MKKSTALIQRNLTLILLIGIYLIMAVIHWFYDSFLPDEQAGLLLVMVPFFAVGWSLDFILNRNEELDKGLKLFAKLCPSFIFLMQGITSALIILEQDPIELFDYLLWLTLALPFFIASYQRKEHRRKLILSLIGTGAVVLAYLYLTTLTDQMNEGYGALIYFITYFFMIYTASGIRKLPYLGMALGIANAAALLWMRYQPVTSSAQLRGWDYDMYLMVDLSILITLILSILLRLAEELLPINRVVTATKIKKSYHS